MAKKGDMFYAWTNDAEIKKKAELGGAVTGLWKHALESKMVDAVLAIKKGIDLYDAQPVLIKDAKELAQTAGSLHCGTLLVPKLVKKYLDGAEKMKIAVTVKGCDAMGLYELAKRKQVNLDNVVMIGVNCGGSVSPFMARKMITEKFGVDPDKVHKEEIDKGQFIIEFEGAPIGECWLQRMNLKRILRLYPGIDCRRIDMMKKLGSVLGLKIGLAIFTAMAAMAAAA
jgi:formate dehydrogenase subunit beta